MTWTDAGSPTTDDTRASPRRVRRLHPKVGPLVVGLALMVSGLLTAAARAEGGFDPRILPAHPLYARNAGCRPVRLAVPAPTHRLPGSNLISPQPSAVPMGQGDSAICFAYATADMISQRVGRVVSPLDVATKFYFADPARLALTRNPLIQAHLRAHPQVHRDIAWSRNAVEVSRDGNLRGEPYFDKLEGGEEDAAALLYNLDGLCDERDLPSHEGYAHFTRTFAALRARPRLTRPPLSPRHLGATVPHLRSRRADPFNAEWRALVEERCRRRASPVPLLPVSYRVAANQHAFMEMNETGRPPSRDRIARMLAMIDYALDHRRAPAVGYSWFILQARLASDPDTAADHSSTIVARRRAGGTCQYLVQDNTGEYCSRMRDGIGARCRDGRVWLTEGELSRTLYSVIYLR